MVSAVTERPEPVLQTEPAHALHNDADLQPLRDAQSAWARVPVRERVKVIKRTRHLLAANCREIAATVEQPARGGTGDGRKSIADTLIAELLPLAEACRFLEREAAGILRPHRLGKSGLPFWLRGVDAEVQRVPCGLVLVLAPRNYPLFLPAVQCMQALAAGNAVLWKPAPGGMAAARACARLLSMAGLPKGLLRVLDDSVRAGLAAIEAGVDKVFLTGHAETGRLLLRELAQTLTPSVMELSGCDAVFVLPGADLDRTAMALAFGMRLNGSATCMAPRRVFAIRNTEQTLIAKLLSRLETIASVTLPQRSANLLDDLIRDAQQKGARLLRDGRSSAGTAPCVLLDVPEGAAILRTDIFAPVLSFCSVRDEAEALAMNAKCPYGLTAAIFGPEHAGRALAVELRCGTVLINDLIVSTADPRVPFGGRDGSGFGVTRGREGLLEMTAVKTVLTQSQRGNRPYQATTEQHEPFFASYIEAAHGGSTGMRLRAVRNLFAAARKIKKD